MKKIALLILFFSLLFPFKTYGQEALDNDNQKDEINEEQVVESLEDLMELDDLDDFSREYLPEKMNFEDLVEEVRKDGLEGKSFESIFDYILDFLFYEIQQLIPVIKQVAVIGIGLTVLNKSIFTKNSYIEDVNYLMIYGLIMGILLESFSGISTVVIDGLSKIIEFMTVMIPVYASSLVMSQNVSSASSFYTLSFCTIYIVEWITKIVIIPAINILVLLEFLNQIFDEDKLSRMSQFLEKIIRGIFKVTLSVVVGINIIKTMISPVKDRLADSALLKGVGVIPGIGRIAGSGGEILLSCGMLIKNSVGVSVLILLCVIIFVPVMKVLAYDLSFNLLVAFLQPISNNKLIKGMSSVTKGCSLYLKMLTNIAVLFFITVAIVCTTTSFVH